MSLSAICEDLNLGELLGEPERQIGGSLHTIWRVVTSRGEFTIKQIDQNNLKLLGDRLLSIPEYCQVSSKCNFPSATLHKIADKHYLVRRWVPGKTIDNIDIEQAKHVAKIVNSIHQSGVEVAPRKAIWCPVDLTKWRTVINSIDDPKVITLKNSWRTLDTMNTMVEHNHSTFSKNLITSHRDISTSNTIWNDQSEPTLIDWEFAGQINNELDVFITAMNFDRSGGAVFQTIIDYYYQPLTMSHSTLIAGYYGYCLDWMDFNIDRLLHYPQQSAIAIDQLQVCFDAILQNWN